MSAHLKLCGTFYNVGKQLGEHNRAEIKQLINDFKKSELCTKINEYLHTTDGQAVYKQLYETVNALCADYVTELRGMADGADVDLSDLLKINLDSEFAALLGETPDASHGVAYARVFAGCTNITIGADDGKVYFAHTEDIEPGMVQMALMVSVEIVDDNGHMLESWTEYVVPGVLAGSKFGFNSHGVMFGHNNMYQNGINSKGIPRKFMCRSLLKISSASEAIRKLQSSPGIASANSFQFLQRTPDGGVSNYVIEAAGDPHVNVEVFEPKGFYHHCNMFQHLQYPCHPEESSVHRAAVISQYVNRYQVCPPVSALTRAISDQADVKFPVHRNGKKPDYLATGATGIYDVMASKIDVYTGVPSESVPTFTFTVPSINSEDSSVVS